MFGSYARGHNQENIDIDIDIVVELKKPDFLILVGIKQMFEDDMDVDVVQNRERMNRTLKKDAEKERIEEKEGRFSRRTY